VINPFRVTDAFLSDGELMGRTLKNIAVVILAALIPLVSSFAAPPIKLTVAPFDGRASNVQVLGPVSSTQFWVLANTRYSSPPKCELFVSDGTDLGTHKLVDVVSDGTCGPITTSRVFDGKTFYFGMERLNSTGISEGVELQTVTETSATQSVISPGLVGSNPDSFVLYMGTVYFAATESMYGREVWHSRGTIDSTKLYKEFRTGSSGSNPSDLTVYNNRIYLSADDGKVGQELWVLNTDVPTAFLVKDLAVGLAGSSPTSFFEYGGLLFFSANVSGRNLYANIGEGVINTTALFKDILIAGSTAPSNFSRAKSSSSSLTKMHFLADTVDTTGTYSWAIWRSDGTAAATTQVATVSGHPKYVGTLTGGDVFVFQHVRSTGAPQCQIVAPANPTLCSSYGTGSNGPCFFPCYYPTIINGSLYYTEYGTADYRLARFDITGIPTKSIVMDPMMFNEARGFNSTLFIAHEPLYGSDYSVTDRECPLGSGDKKFPGACGCTAPDTDTDHDGTPDCKDGCSADPNKVAPGGCGCGVADKDTDGDGTPDCKDLCPADPVKVASGICGCGVSDVDSDKDDTADCKEECDTDPNKTAPGACGCGALDTDTDRDGVADCKDGCSTDASKTAPGACGCGNADKDTDADKTPDCLDRCPNDATKSIAGSCGCGFPDTDSDGDGDPECLDPCNADPNKKTPGVCGCGVPDTDRDKDGILDCKDGCPDNKAKTLPGVCGCAVADVDSDRDGVMDCIDGCVGDSSKSSSGSCGCGVADTDTDKDRIADCIDLCPSDSSKAAPGYCGCGKAEHDMDGDQLPDCLDGCPAQADKKEPGVCGCALTDVDSDKDGTADCIDACPANPAKSKSSGQCGCSVEEIFSDSDSVPDCLDGCPKDPGKIQPGACGCGVQDVDTNGDGAPDCLQTDSMKRPPTAPLITFARKVVIIGLPSNVGGKGQVNTVSFRFKSSVKGKDKWGKLTKVRTRANFLKVKLPNGALGVEASYVLTAFRQQSPSSATVYREAP